MPSAGVVFTTNFVVAETHALVLNRLGRDRAETFLRQMEDSSTNLIRAEVGDEQTARAILYRYSDKSFSLTDAISFAVMERLGLREAFAFDRNFQQYGFEMLQP